MEIADHPEEDPIGGRLRARRASSERKSSFGEKKMRYKSGFFQKLVESWGYKKQMGCFFVTLGMVVVGIGVFLFLLLGGLEGGIGRQSSRGLMSALGKRSGRK